MTIEEMQSTDDSGRAPLTGNAAWLICAEICQRLDLIASLLPIESIQIGQYKVSGHGIITNPEGAIPDTLEIAKQRGRLAYDHAFNLSDSPYPYNSPLNVEWLAGWEERRRERGSQPTPQEGIQ